MKFVIFLLILGLSSSHVLGFIPLGNLENSLNSDYYNDYGTETIKENTLKEGNLLHEFQNAVMKTKIKFLNLLDAVSRNILDIFSLNTVTKTATTTTTAPTTTVTVTESTTTKSPLTSTILSTTTEEPMDIVDNTTLENPESTEPQTETV